MENGKSDWLPIGEEPLAHGSITHLSVLRGDGLSALSLPSGEIDAESEPSAGLYYQDTRHLSKLRFSFGGVAPLLLDSGETDQTLSAIFTNSGIRPGGPEQEVVPQNSLIARRRRVVHDALRESLTLSNYARTPCQVDVRIEFGADFEDIFVIRGFKRKSAKPEVVKDVRGDRVRFRYTGVDEKVRTTIVQFSEKPTEISQTQATFLCPLEPGETKVIEFAVSVGEEKFAKETVRSAVRRVTEAQHEFLAAATTIETDNQQLNRALERGLLDIHALTTTVDGVEFVAAGVPWFDTLFGRDSLITGMQLAAFAPGLLGKTLRLLASYQADEADDRHDATPGKLPHELRWGELANIGEVPFGRYYGSVDSTPLFIVAAGEYARWTEDVDTIQEIWPQIRKAMDWCIDEIEGDPNGFLSYSRISAGGLENQGWKDSHDAVVWPDGSLVEPPIALVEVQGYVLAAFYSFMGLARLVGDQQTERVGKLTAEFEDRFDRSFSDTELGYIYCLDGAGRRVATPVSNGGHLMWSGAARLEQARVLAARLMAPDMFSGWGVRTISTEVKGYNPLGYHMGTVWPHDNSLIFAGFRGYGVDEQAFVLGNAIVEAALAFPAYRIPELFSGDNRELRSVPTPFPVASRPQAWSAASLPFVMASFLGVRPGGDRQLVVSRPMLPRNVSWVRVRNLRVGRGTADLTFRSQGNRVSVEVESLRNGLQVVLSQAHPDPW
jgi:glycogen debranching enzyme